MKENSNSKLRENTRRYANNCMTRMQNNFGAKQEKGENRKAE